MQILTLAHPVVLGALLAGLSSDPDPRQPSGLRGRGIAFDLFFGGMGLG